MLKMQIDQEPKIFVILGPSGVGKTSVLRCLETNHGIETTPKHTTRPSRNTSEDIRDFIFCKREDFPAQDILIFESYGHYFGIDLAAIRNSIRRGKSCAIVVGDCEVVKKLSSMFGHKSMIVILIFCDSQTLKKRIADSSRLERWPKIVEELSNIYGELRCVNFVVNNSFSLGETFEQIEDIVSMVGIQNK